ncbi:MAG: chondroitin AC lyase [Candidatus Latescibacterota bacterium]|jgi:chondroitin AC lyase
MTDPDMNTLRQRLLEPLLKSADSSVARILAVELNADGQWASVDYTDQDRASWATSRHLNHLHALAKAYATGAEDLRPAVFSALDHWLEYDYSNPNWWHNEIGVPRLLAPTLLLLGDELNPTQFERGVAILARATLSKTGQNLVWLAGISAQRGLLLGDADLVATSYARIADEIHLTAEEGIQVDYSFHQHGACLYNHGYGSGFASDGARIAALLNGTRFAFEQEKVDLLTALVLDGHQWFTRGTWQDYGSFGREIARAGHNGAYLRRVAEDLLELSTGREAELRQLRHRLDEKAPPLVGHRHFWRGDISVQQRPSFYASARFYSDRLLNTDKPHNEEALLSHHIADGCTFISRTDKEYADIFPVWNWQHIPGTTIVQTPELSGELCRWGSRPFAGGVSDGQHGLAAIDFERDGLQARKSWFFFADTIIALGAGITDSSGHAVHTTINQCFLNGEAVRGEGGENTWVYHDGIAYFTEKDAKLQLTQDEHTGSWWRISRSTSQEPITHKLFDLWVDHGRAPQDASYAYSIAPTMSLQEVQNGQRPAIETIANTATIQAVRETELGLTGIVFYRPGSIDIAPDWNVAADQSCLLLLRRQGNRLYVSVANPQNEYMELAVTISQRISGEEVTTLPNGGSRLVLELPDGMEAGRSATWEFEVSE